MSASDLTQLEHVIEAAFDNRDTVTTTTKGEIRDAVETALNLLDSGKVRVAARGEDGTWTVHQWLKKAVLLSFRLNANGVVAGSPGGGAPATAGRVDFVLGDNHGAACAGVQEKLSGYRGDAGRKA